MLSPFGDPVLRRVVHMKIAIHQPNYLPYPGFFAKMNCCDVFVLYDKAQFTRGDFINRNRVRGFSTNQYVWLTLPVGKKNFEGIAINQIRIASDKVFSAHSNTIRFLYSKALFFDTEICECVATPHYSLAEHNITLIQFLIDKLHMKHPKIILSSGLDTKIRHGTEGIIDIVKSLHGDEYISGTGGKEYLKTNLFRDESIKLSFIDYEPLKYHQIHPGFVVDMSLIDAIFNIGWEETSSRISCSKAHS